MDLLRDAAAVTGSTGGKLRKVNLFETARCFCDVYVAAPGQSQPAHAHEGSDKVYYVLSGRGTVTVGAERHEVREGHAVFCPAGATHGVACAGPGDLRLLVFMAPHPRPPG
jgi:quercetin dioxygenase-like cupin family protein